MILIGTSGWNYQHWKGKFYPEKLSQRKWLEYFTTQFKTVELNSSFYHIPKESVTKSWFSRTPQDFYFSIKVSRLVSHVHKLKECEEILKWFFTSCAPLSGKIAVYLIQLPPSFCPDTTVLEDFFSQLISSAKRYAQPESKSNRIKLRFSIEIRNEKCEIETLEPILRKYNIALCLHDYSREFNYTSYTTADFTYIRFHGYRKRYGNSYPQDILQEWANRIKQWDKADMDVFAYFNNDFEGFAVENARLLRELVKTESPH